MNALLRAAGLSIAALGLLSGCNDDKTTASADAGVEDAGSQKPLLGGKLGAAVAAAESGSSQPTTKQAPGDGPPEAGFFPPGGADQAQPPGAPPKVELLNDGAEPRVALVVTPPAEQQVQVLASYRMGPQGGLPPFLFDLSFKAEKSKAKDEKDAKADATPIVAKVVAVSVPGAAGKLPKELSDGLDKLKGSEIRFRLTPSGSMLDVTTTGPKDKDKNPEIAGLFDLAMRGMVEAVTLVEVPLPQKPVGAGGFWMVTDRSTAFGIDVVRYRVFRVQKVDKDQATLTVETREYAVKDEIDLGAMAQGQKMTAERFDSQGKGTTTWKSNEVVSTASEVTQRTTIMLGGTKGAPSKGGLQVEFAAKTTEADKSDKKK